LARLEEIWGEGGESGFRNFEKDYTYSSLEKHVFSQKAEKNSCETHVFFKYCRQNVFGIF